jgi:hypothetical protein
MQEPLDTLVYTLYTGLLAHCPHVYVDVNPATSSSAEHSFAGPRPYL